MFYCVDKTTGKRSSLKTTNQDEARQWVAKAEKLPRTGSGWRYLSSIAAKHNLPLNAKTEFSDAVAVWVDPFFHRGAFLLAMEPAKHVAVALESAAAPGEARRAAASQPTTATAEARTITIEPGAPLVITAVLSNTGSVPVPLGEWGLLSARMVVTVRLECDAGRVKADTSVPVIWPAPRMLEAGKSLRQQVNLETPEIGTILASRPLQEVTLTVGGIVDPVERHGGLAPALTAIEVAPLTIRRQSLLDKRVVESYKQALSRLAAAVRKSASSRCSSSKDGYFCRTANAARSAASAEVLSICAPMRRCGS